MTEETESAMTEMTEEKVGEEKELKHLGFVPAAANSAIATAEPYYKDLKAKAGPLKVRRRRRTEGITTVVVGMGGDGTRV